MRSRLLPMLALASFPAVSALFASPAARQAPAELAEPAIVARLEGTVLRPDGEPARGAVVVTTAGGQAAVGADGAFALEIALPAGTDALELTAVSSCSDATLVARRSVAGLSSRASRRVGVLKLAASAGCDPAWLPTFGGAPGPDGTVYAMVVFDDGSGPAVVVGGDFKTVAGLSAPGVARWDGEAWSAVGAGIPGDVRALTVLDLGAGPRLYAGGNFQQAGGVSTSNVARLDGSTWSALGGGVSGTVLSLAAHDDGSGPALFVGGHLTGAGGHGQPASLVARWDGAAWDSLAGGLPSGTSFDYVADFAEFDDGLGPRLYAGGGHQLWSWNGASWDEVDGLSGFVLSMAVLDDGGGTALYVGGSFLSAVGLPAGNGVLRWDGQAWSAVGAGVGYYVTSLGVHDDGSGPMLVVGGSTYGALGPVPSNLMSWDGQVWTDLDGGADAEVYALLSADLGAGPTLFVGGSFGAAGADGAPYLAEWDGAALSALDSPGLPNAVRALAVFDDGSGDGPALYAGGAFLAIGDLHTGGVARWDGKAWSAVGGGADGAVWALVVHDDGGGPALFAGGAFQNAGGAPASGVARWDGAAWSALGAGTMSSSGSKPKVQALAVYDDGAGAALFAGGDFLQVGVVQVNGIARWDGLAWSALGTGVNGAVDALAVFDDGSGPQLFAGGVFSLAGGVPASSLARWNGSTWSAVGAGVNSWVHALCPHDDGSGSTLFVGGNFTSGFGVSLPYVARWDGVSLLGVGGGTDGPVRVLTSFDDGSGGGTALYAGGAFATAGGAAAERIARWDGAAWSGLSTGMSAGTASSVFALLGLDDGSGGGPALYAGGSFSISAGGDSHLARRACPTVVPIAGCFGNPAALSTSAGAAAVGAAFPVSLEANALSSGIGALMLGHVQTDASGCGLLVPGIGELLLGLAPAPAAIASGALAQGSIDFPLAIPAQPSFVGAQVGLHGVAFGAVGPANVVELSNALAVTLTQ